MPDGTYKTLVYPDAVNFEAADGSLQPIDNTLEPAADPTYAAENAANDYQLLLPSELGQTPIKVDDGEASVSFAPTDAAGQIAVSGSTATYDDATAGVTYAYEAGNNMVEETLTLGGPESPSSFSFSLDTSAGLTATENTSGGIDFTDPSGTLKFSFAAPVMWDGAGIEAPEGAVTLALGSTSTGGSTVDLAADAEWLQSPDRQWPVVIDPTLLLADPAASIRKDCYLQDGANANTSFCTNARIRVGFNGSSRFRGLLKFDVSSIPQTATVLNADLSLYLGSTTTTNAADIEVHRVTTAWNDSATWNSPDGTASWVAAGGDFDAAVDATANVSGGTGLRHWYPTGLVQKWVDGTSNYGLLLKQAGETVNNVLALYSVNQTDSTKWPVLTVTYSEGLGELKYFKFDTQDLDDRMHLHVNYGNGNLLLHEQDLLLKGVHGYDLKVERFYNSLSTDSSALGQGWVYSPGADVRVEAQSSGDVAYFGPSGYRVLFKKSSGTCPIASNATFYTAPAGIDGDFCKLSDGSYKLKFFSKERYNFDTSGKLTSMVDNIGQQITLSYNANGSLGTITETHNRVVSFGYDASGRLSSVTDTASTPNRVYTYGYNANGLLSDYYDAKYPSPSSTHTHFDYDASNRLYQITSPAGYVTKIDYDGTTRRVKNVIRVTQSNSDTDPTTTFTYDTANMKTHVVDPRNQPSGPDTVYKYDDDGKITDVWDAKGNRRKTSYTTRGNVATYTDAGMTSSEAFGFSYDPSNPDNLTGVTLPTGAAATMKYEDSSNPHYPTKVFDFQNHNASSNGDATWVYSYDPDNGNLKEAKDGQATPGVDYVYSYIPTGNANPGLLDTITDSRSKVTDYNYFANGDLKEIIPPSPVVKTSFTYDSVSRVKTVTDGNGKITKYTYDPIDRITRIDFYDAGANTSVDSSDYITYDYDANGNRTKRDESGLGTINYGFDELNRLTSETPPGSSNSAIQYEYYTSGNLYKIHDNGRDTIYEYDVVNMLTKVTTPKNEVITFDYDADRDDLRIKTSYPGGTKMYVAWDKSGRQCNIVATTTTLASPLGCSTNVSSPMLSFKYSFADDTSDTNLKQSVTDKNGYITKYTYDLIDRLTRAKTLSGTTVLEDYHYAYDGNSNMTCKTVGTAMPIRYVFNDANELTDSYRLDCTAAITGSAARHYDYDSNGNLLAASNGASFTYNRRNQTTSITPPTSLDSSLGDPLNVTPGGSTAAMTYQDASQVRRMTEGSTTFGYNVLGLGLQQSQNNTGAFQTDSVPPSKTTYYVRDNQGTLLEEILPGNDNLSYFYLFDSLGSVVGLADGGGNVAATYAYEAFGRQTSAEPSVANPWRFASGYYDSAAGGLYKFGARFDDPGTARWTQTDPKRGDIKDPMSLDLYLYAHDCPVNRVDPDGTFDWGELGKACVIGGVAEGVGAMVAAAIIAQLSGEALLPAVPIAGVAGAIGGCVTGVIADLFIQLW